MRQAEVADPGKGYADLLYLSAEQKLPALLVELKFRQSKVPDFRHHSCRMLRA